MEKVAPSERFRSELDEVLAGVGGEEDPIETVGRLGARLILQQALEDEVSEFLGRRRYERAGETVGHRNGYEARTVKTTSGAMRLERPRIRDASRLGFESRILGKGVARTHALESPGDQRLPAGSLHPGCGGCVGGLRGVDRVEEHGLADL
jgi:putative transposase